MQRRHFLSVSLAIGAAPIMCSARAASDSRFVYLEATIAQLQARMASRRLTAHTLTAAYLKRIDQIDQHGPKINSIIELYPGALAIAAELDRERRVGRTRSPLHGIPIVLKDNIDTAD